MSGYVTGPSDIGILRELKDQGEKIVALTAYSVRQARMIAPLVDFILVGDSVTMNWYDLGTTKRATLDMMIKHGKRVVSGAAGQAMVVIDMPECVYAFPEGASDHDKDEIRDDTLIAARRIMRETGCQALKLEGGVEMAETVRMLVRHHIPVMGHIGLLPSKFDKGERYVVAAKGQEAAQKLVNDAIAIQNANAFSIVIEGSNENVASLLCKEVLKIPTIGIGATPDADGQILVNRDVWKKPDATPMIKFAPSFRIRGFRRQEAVALYAAAVRGDIFPDRKTHCYHPKMPVDIAALQLS